MKKSVSILLFFTSLLFVSAFMYKVSGEESNILKISDELEATLSQLSPNDTLLLWLDVYIPPFPPWQYLFVLT